MRRTPDKSHIFLTGNRPGRGSLETVAATLRQNHRFSGKVRDKHLHSKEHVVAEDLSRAMREPNRFAAYLGIAKLYYESDLRALARYILEKEDLPPEARGKYFFASLKRLTKMPGVKLNRRKKNKKKRNGNHKTNRQKSE